MVAIVLTPEQINNAPPEVRAWIERQIVADLGRPAAAAAAAQASSAVAPQHASAFAAPAACDGTTARVLLEQIRDDRLACRVFLELGRPGDGGGVAAAKPGPFAIHAIPAAEVMAHTGIPDASRLTAYLGAINELYRTVTGRPGGIVALDPRGYLYVHEATHRCIGELWSHLVEGLSDRQPEAPAGGPAGTAGRHAAAGHHAPTAAAVSCTPPYHVADRHTAEDETAGAGAAGMRIPF